MEVTYQLEPKDVSQLFRYVRGYRSKIRPAFLYAFLGLMIGGMLIGNALIALNSSSQSGKPDFPIALISTVYVFYIVYRWIIKPRFAERKTIKDPKVLSRKTMAISSVGIFVRHSLGEVTLHWPLIKDIVDYKDCFYFFLEKNNAFTVPKRAFPNLGEAQQFYETARQDWLTAKNLTSPNQTVDPETWPPPPQVQKPQEPGNL